MLPLKALEKNLSHLFLLASGIAGNPWLSLACRHIILISASFVVLFLCVFMSSSLCAYLCLFF